MAFLTRNKAPEGHWYQVDGTPAHRLPTKDGSGDRPTTIRDAKRLGLYPSVTSILGILNRPMLERWKLDQVALATLRLPKQLDDVSTYPVITQGLIDRGYRESDIRKVLGENVLGVFQRVEQTAARLKEESGG